MAVGVLGERDPRDGTASNMVRILYRGLYSGERLLPESNFFLFSLVFVWIGVTEPDLRIRFEDEVSGSKANEAEESLQSIVSVDFSVIPRSIEFKKVFPRLGFVEEVKLIGFDFWETPFSEFSEFCSISLNFARCG